MSFLLKRSRRCLRQTTSQVHHVICYSTTRRQYSSDKKPETQQAVFSGIQPTGVPHLGNYLGALRQWVEIQRDSPNSTKLVYCIVDLHAITQAQDPKQLRRWKWESLATLLAIGLDPERCIIFEQSRVPAHSELMWILSCTASMGKLNRMTQWKVRYMPWASS